MVCAEDCLLLITEFNVNIVEAPAYIQLGEILHILELSNQFRDQGKWILVFNYKCIEIFVILYQVEKSILFLNKKH